MREETRDRQFSSLAHRLVVKPLVCVKEIDTGKRHPKVLCSNFLHRLSRLGPGKAVTLQAFCPQAESGSVPVRAPSVRPAPGAAEQVHALAEGIGTELFYHQRKAVDLFSHIGHPRADEQPHAREVDNHRLLSSTRITPTRSSRSLSAFTMISIPPESLSVRPLGPRSL